MVRLPINEPLVPVLCVYEGTELGPIWLCQACAKVHEIPPEGATLDGDAGMDKFWVTIDWSPVCPMCFKELRGR